MDMVNPYHPYSSENEYLDLRCRYLELECVFESKKTEDRNTTSDILVSLLTLDFRLLLHLEFSELKAHCIQRVVEMAWTGDYENNLLSLLPPGFCPRAKLALWYMCHYLDHVDYQCIRWRQSFH